MKALDWLLKGEKEDGPPHFDTVAMMAIGTLVEDIAVLKPHSTYKVFQRRLEKLDAIADLLQTPKRWGGVR